MTICPYFKIYLIEWQTRDPDLDPGPALRLGPGPGSSNFRVFALSSTLMCLDIWKVFQTITLTHPTNFVSVNIAINLFPGDQDGPDPQVPVPFTQLKTDVCGHLEGVPDYLSYTSQ